MRYPVAERGPVVDDLHAHRVADPYRWLEEPASARTRAWSHAQALLWQEHAAALPGRAWFRSRVAELTDLGMVTAPTWRAGRRFWLRRTAGEEHPVLRTATDGDERTLIDPVALDPTGHTTLDSWQPDGTGARLAYQLSRRGDERADLYVLDVASGQVLDGPIGPCRYAPVAWLPGGAAFFYVRSPTDAGSAALRRRVFLHRVGTPTDDDVAVFGAGRDDPTSYGLDLSEDGRWLVVSAAAGAASGNELWLADLAGTGPEAPEPRLIHAHPTARAVAHVHRDGRLYLVTDLDAPYGRLCVADPGAADGGWRDLVPEEPGAAVAGFAVLDGTELPGPVLLVSRIRRAVGEIGVHDLRTGRRLARVPLPGAGSVGHLSVRPGDHRVWFTYTDSVTPPTVYRFDARTGHCAVWDRPPGGSNSAAGTISTTERTFRSADGTPVRVTVLAGPAAGAGPRPTILYGYGGFGRPVTPVYSAYLLAWVRAGGVFAIAHLRGGDERAGGRLGAKQHVFDDYVAAAEGLIAAGWTTTAQLGACGESNGGLVVGAALTRRPDLFAAVVCSAPVLDMVRYERSGLGPAWRAEYGSAADPEQLRWLLSYSPYHRVRSGVAYPAVLFTVFDGDSRVDPMHARKMCAALQWATAGTRPVLLRAEHGVGHGARAVSSGVALAADLLAFLAAHTGLRVGGGAS